MKNCPFCLEENYLEAIKCRECGTMLPQNMEPQRMQSVATDKVFVRLYRSWIFTIFLAFMGGACVKWTFQLIEVESYWSILTGLLAIGLLGKAFLRDICCSFCKKEDSVFFLKENHECSKCKTLHIIDWY